MELSFGQWLLLRRRALGLGQQAIADRLNVSRQTISNWETGTSEPALAPWQYRELLAILQSAAEDIPAIRPNSKHAG